MRGFVETYLGRIKRSSFAAKVGPCSTGQADGDASFASDGAISSDAAELSRELLFQYQAGNVAAATVLALRVAEIKFASLGERHLEFAAALSHYALLLQAGGDLKGALDGLGEVLDIRVENLGTRHSLVAMTLSQLGMLLVESNEWDDAEGALLESVEIRAALGEEGHPGFATDQKMLAMLAERREAYRPEAERPSVPVQPPAEPAITEPGPVVSINAPEPSSKSAAAIAASSSKPDAPATSAPLSAIPPVVSASPIVNTPPIVNVASTPSPASTFSAPAPIISPLPQPAGAAARENAPAAAAPASRGSEVGSITLRDPEWIKNEVQAMAGVFTRIGRGMISSGQRMKSQGLPPNPQLLHEVTTCYRKFAALCDEAIRRAEALDLDLTPFLTPGEDRISLPDLKLLYDEIFRSESDSAKHYLARKTTLALIARILDLTHCDPRKQSSLEPVLDMARRLQAEVKESPMGKVPAEALAIVDGSHPLFALDRLVTSHDELDDDTWTRLYEILANSQGKRVATAAARKRIKFRTPVAVPDPAESETNGSSPASSTPQHLADLMDSLLDDEDFMPKRGNRDNLKNRIVIPDRLHNRPILGSAPRADALKPNYVASEQRRETASSIPEPARSTALPEPNKTTRVDPLPEQIPAPTRPVSRESDPYDFLRTQTSIITQC